MTNSSPLGVGQAPVENSWGAYKTKNVAQKKLALTLIGMTLKVTLKHEG